MTKAMLAIQTVIIGLFEDGVVTTVLVIIKIVRTMVVWLMALVEVVVVSSMVFRWSSHDVTCQIDVSECPYGQLEVDVTLCPV